MAWAALAAVYVAAWLAFDRLLFPVQRDELHFWPTTLLFSKELFPDLALLRDYPDLNTPLPFLIWGWLENLFGGGIGVGRHFNFALSLAMTLFIAAGQPGREWPAALCAAGMLAFPYFLGTSTHLYTDVIATCAVLAGMALHLRGRYVWSAVAFVLAVSSRQFMVAFPAALLAYGLYQWHSLGKPRAAALVSTFVASASLLGWFLLFGGFAPPTAMMAQNLDVAAPLLLHPSYGLYFLSMVGLYFAVVEMALFRNARELISRASWREVIVLVALLGAFVLFPPLTNQAPFPTFGFTDAAVQALLPDPLRWGLYFALAALALVRFLREPLPLLLIGANAVVLCKAHTAWDKYAMPTLVVLWYLKRRAA